MSDPLLVRALRREQVERTPVWFMRQAGRSLPEYRALRERHSFFEIAETPELCAEVTLQPVRRHGVDAAVLFADIMTPVLGMGIGVELVEGVGPVVESPVASAADVERLRVPDASAFEPVLEAVRIVRRELEPERALVGFCGGPFTVAGYLVEGKPSRDFVRVKELMYRDPATWHALLDRLTDTFCVYVAAKAEAGADAIQLFDSWVGALSVADYEEFVAPYSARILAAVDVPTIHFGTGTSHLLGRDGRRRRRLHRPRLAHPARRGLARRRPRPRRAGEPRPRRPPRPVAPHRVRRPWTSSPAPGRPPLATSSTSATASCPAQILRICAGWSSSSTSGLQPHVSDAAVVLMAYGSPDRIEDVPAYYADIRGGGRSRPSGSTTSSRATGGSGSRTPIR